MLDLRENSEGEESGGLEVNVGRSAVTKLKHSQVVCGSLEVHKSCKEDYRSYE